MFVAQEVSSFVKVCLLWDDAVGSCNSMQLAVPWCHTLQSFPHSGTPRIWFLTRMTVKEHAPTCLHAMELQKDGHRKHPMHCISCDFTIQEQTELCNWPTSLNIIQFTLMSLIHSSNQPINEMLPVAMVTAFLVMPRLLSVATSCTGQLKWPHEVVSFLEVTACTTSEEKGS